MLPESVVACYFGRSEAPPVLKLGLFQGNAEIADGGYRRASVVKGEWRVIGRQATVTVGFGPFDGPVRFNEARILDGDDVLSRLPFDGQVTLVAGMTYEHDAEVIVNG